MPRLLVGNAPCSWGTLEFDEARGENEAVCGDDRLSGLRDEITDGLDAIPEHADARAL